MNHIRRAEPHSKAGPRRRRARRAAFSSVRMRGSPVRSNRRPTIAHASWMAATPSHIASVTKTPAACAICTARPLPEGRPTRATGTCKGLACICTSSYSSLTGSLLDRRTAAGHAVDRLRIATERLVRPVTISLRRARREGGGE